MPRAAVQRAHLRPALELAEINREIVATRSTIAEIDRVLAQLDDADAELLRAWYIEHKSKEQIADELSYSSKTSIYDLRNKAVAAFAVLYYGAGAPRLHLAAPGKLKKVCTDKTAPLVLRW